IGCTMPGFPDKFSPIYATPPGSLVSSTASRILGGFIRRMRRISMSDKNRSIRWTEGPAPSGWARYKSGPTGATKLLHKAYKAYQNTNKA
ncbi:MAG: hydrogenase expression protein HypE, partial [Actinobacteria bacterium]|nr:hydrogenase expression protein HypE [Actinomycetota bacterium]